MMEGDLISSFFLLGGASYLHHNRCSTLDETAKGSNVHLYWLPEHARRARRSAVQVLGRAGRTFVHVNKSYSFSGITGPGTAIV